MTFRSDDLELDHQLCGPDGGFTTAGRDSLLFQVFALESSLFTIAFD